MLPQNGIVFDPKILQENYQHQGLVGSGFDGTIHLFQHKETKNLFALKCVEKNQHLYNIKSEVYLLSHLKHPHIVEYVGRSIDYTCLLLAYYKYGNLMNVLKLPLEMNVGKRVIMQLADALLYLHKMNIVHGDLKPQNILISDDYKVKLCDFGFSRVIDPQQPQRGVGGSPGYTAPELHTQQAIVQDLKKCDAFALGVIFFNLITRKQPFLRSEPWMADDNWEFLRLEKYDKFWGLFDIALPEEFKLVIQSLLKASPEQRWSVEDLVSNPWMLIDLATDEQLAQSFHQRLSELAN